MAAHKAHATCTRTAVRSCLRCPFSVRKKKKKKKNALIVRLTKKCVRAGAWGGYCFTKKKMKAGQKRSLASARAKDGEDAEVSELFEHSLTSGAKPAPKTTKDGRRTFGNWDFHYDTSNPVKVPRADRAPHAKARKDDLFPKGRGRIWNLKRLKAQGMSRARLLDHDALWFANALQPASKEPEKLRGREPWLTQIEMWSGNYIYMKEWQSNKRPKPPTRVELVRVEGINSMHGALGGNRTCGIGERWNRQGAHFNNDIYEALPERRYYQIMRVIKLNLNNSDNSQKAHPDYDPAHKFEFVFRNLIFNLNHFTVRAALNQTIDEMTAGCKYGEAGLVKKLKNKPGVTQGAYVGPCHACLHVCWPCVCVGVGVGVVVGASVRGRSRRAPFPRSLRRSLALSLAPSNPPSLRRWLPLVPLPKSHVTRPANATQANGRVLGQRFRARPRARHVRAALVTNS